MKAQAQPATGVRDAILAAALHLFARKGYSETSVQEIVAAAGVTKGAFYYYFTSKDAVLECLHDQFLEYELRLVEDLRRYHGTPPEKLRKLVGDLIGSIVLYRRNVAVFFQEVDRLPPERRSEVERRRKVYQQYVEDLISEGIRGGYFRPDLDPRIATLGILGLANYTYRWLNPQGEIALERVVGMLADMATSSVLADPHGRGGKAGEAVACRDSREDV